MLRERFTVSGGDRTVTRLYVRPAKQSGTDPLIVSIRDSVGNVIETFSISASSLPTFTVPAVNGQGTGGVWIGLVLSQPRILQNGQTYEVRFSTASGSLKSVTPIHHTQDNTTDASSEPLKTRLQSYAFRDGTAQRSTNGGTSWSSLYSSTPTSLPWFLTVQ